jgi:DNA-binding NarL/FixJ family response regulator
MITGRPKKPMTLDEEQRLQLVTLSHSRSIPHGLVERAKIILLAAQGFTNSEVAERL